MKRVSNDLKREIRRDEHPADLSSLDFSEAESRVANRILVYIQALGSAQTESEILSSVVGKRSTKVKVLRSLFEASVIHRSARGKKGNPFRYHTNRALVEERAATKEELDLSSSVSEEEITFKDESSSQSNSMLNEKERDNENQLEKLNLLINESGMQSVLKILEVSKRIKAFWDTMDKQTRLETFKYAYLNSVLTDLGNESGLQLEIKLHPAFERLARWSTMKGTKKWRRE